MEPKASRVKQEQLRKRRNNLLRRHNDFWRLYAIRSWLTMEMPNGRVYTYHSHPNLSIPTGNRMVSRSQPVIHRTPADYVSKTPATSKIPKAPISSIPKRQNAIWDSFALCMKYVNR
ncbi:hypothetical protein N7456_006857 [Penicillium angulare]|uniref:Uncharacterized protein n=1 Tax=Penicillium angulare TaxID=116970 RepID=A0A9W9FIH6_9EURO|nr:hypothetical protein N7456_006857 [Penicillium angulare]